MIRFLRFLSLCAFALSAATAARADEGETELIHLAQYKPIYFIMGNPYTKIELSFKAQIVRDVPFYFGYTQLMMWDLFAPSPHFYDINYNPEFFYRYKLDGSEQWVDLGPFEHESNGLGGENERSWYKSSVRYHARTEIGERAKLYWDIKAWLPWHSNGNTDQIERYRGAGELNITLSDFLGPFFEKGDLILRIYPGGASAINPVYGGQELTFRAKAHYRAFLPLFVAQIFHGYGENLLDLQDNRWGIRAGIGF